MEKDKDIYQNYLNDFEGQIQATPELSAAEKKHFANLMVFNTGISSDDKDSRYYVSAFKKYYNQRDLKMFGCIGNYTNETIKDCVKEDSSSRPELK